MSRLFVLMITLFSLGLLGACDVLFVDKEEGLLYEACAYRSCIEGLYCVNDRCSEPSVEGGICDTELPCEEGKGLECRNGKCEKAEYIQWVYSKPANLEFAKTETTVDQYAACVQAGRCSKPTDKSTNEYCNWGYDDRGNHPVNCVDLSQAAVFCFWSGGRLPTEEEWFAEASNGKTRDYPWGNQEVSCDYAIWGDGNRTDGCGRDSTWPVCSKPNGNSVSELCDMSGNVWEWTSSSEGSEGSSRVLRGGSWGGNDTDTLRASGRSWGEQTHRSSSRGFRCVR